MSTCEFAGPLKQGETKVTLGYNLPATYVIHSVGPNTEDPILLAQCYLSCLGHLEPHDIRSVAFCSLAGPAYPIEASLHVAFQTIRSWLDKDFNDRKIELIIFCSIKEKEMVGRFLVC